MFLAGSGVMHTLKGGWVGQTFAIAKCNESDSGAGAANSRKSRIRRSKEERKSMVELFIKKYQTNNDGSFPSLNLTHKEVGGSFYTVREIVREVIQENRVLGPAKFLPGEEEFDSDDRFSQDYPLGSIATEPMEVPDSLIIAETQPDLISSLAYVTEDELVKLSEEKQSSDKQLQILNGSEVNLRSCEPVPTTEAEGVVVGNEPVELFEEKQRTDKQLQIVNESEVDLMSSEPVLTTEAEDVVVGNEPVELFEEKQNTAKQLQIVNGSEIDLRSSEPVVTNEAKDVADESVASTSKVIDISNVEVETFPLAPTTGDENIALETSGESDEAGKNLPKSSVAVAENAEAGKNLPNSDFSLTKEGTIHGAENGKSLADKDSFNGASNSKQSENVKEDNVVQAVKATTVVTSENSNGSVPKREAVSGAKPEAPSSKTVLRESSHNPPLNRINLSEAWEASSNTSRRETQSAHINSQVFCRIFREALDGIEIFSA